MKPAGRPTPAISQAAIERPGEYHAQQRAGDAEIDEQSALAGAADQSQPLQAIVEDAAEQEDIGQEADDAGHHQGVEGLVVGTVGRGVARLVVRQIGRVDRVVGDIHGFGPIADEAAPEVLLP